ncbi:MAG: ABC transporter ATP-binding protein, partial [Candidatus Zixiibacteriota bacterium]
MKQVKINSISKTFTSFGRGNVAALRDINLEIKPGTFFVLLGPSGCGKSTLLNIIAGLERPTQGEIWIGEQPVVSTSKRIFLSPRERDIAMVFQSYALYPHMTVADNIGFPLKIAHVSRDEIAAKIDQVASSLELTNLLSVRPAELSGG